MSFECKKRESGAASWELQGKEDIYMSDSVYLCGFTLLFLFTLFIICLGG